MNKSFKSNSFGTLAELRPWSCAYATRSLSGALAAEQRLPRYLCKWQNPKNAANSPLRAQKQCERMKKTVGAYLYILGRFVL